MCNSYYMSYILHNTGTDEKAIIDILAYRTNDQRQQIKQVFKTMYGRVRYMLFLDFYNGICRL